MVGVMSMAVPTTITSSMMANIKSRGLSSSGCSSLMTSAGSCATVISQADTMAAATRNMITAVVLEAAKNKPYKSLNLSSRYTSVEITMA